MILYHISAKKLITRCTFSMLAASLILCPAVFSGCSAKTENVKNTDAGSQDPISATAIKLNTAVTVTIYDSLLKRKWSSLSASARVTVLHWRN